MNLRRIDLNLLVAFDALMQTRHVSRAAAHLGIGQPGMSAALGRLRQLFDDPLLVRRGAEMIPTDRALALQPDIRKLLRGVEEIIAPPEDFSPETSERVFRLRLSDLLSVLLLPALMSNRTQTAPHIRYDIAHLSPIATVDAMERDSVELAVSTGLDCPKSILKYPLFEDSVVCVARADMALAPLIQNAESFAGLPQIRVSQSPIDDRFADRQLEAQDLSRNIVLTVPHWLAAPEILATSDLVAVMPASIAQKLSAHHALQTCALPFLETTFQWSLYWHMRYDNDPGHRWLRQTIIDTHRSPNTPG
ncbi:MAG: LysR family transcriptional regulator [Alphaproteobacteria bacterium]|nr:LysR family transcriptional regulator [Alphaproteobacteria bacterium]